MRCLTFADELSKQGARCTFICRSHNGHLLGKIAQCGHYVMALPNFPTVSNETLADMTYADWLGADWQVDAEQTREALGCERVDWLVVDHYALDDRWEQVLRPHCNNIMVIDDLADRAHDCDLLLDQNLGRSAQDYFGLLKPHTTTCIGPQYALLRPEFAQLRNQSISRRKQQQFKHLLITMGGVDKNNATSLVLQALITCHLPADICITVVMGPHAPHLPSVKEKASLMPWTTQVLVDVNAMAQLMVNSDFCIGAAGSTSWERCCLGLPTLLLVLADNQLSSASALQKIGATLIVNNDQNISQAVEKCMQSATSDQIKSLAMAAATVTDGLGVQRIIAAMQRKNLYG